MAYFPVPENRLQWLQELAPVLVNLTNASHELEVYTANVQTNKVVAGPDTLLKGETPAWTWTEVLKVHAGLKEFATQIQSHFLSVAHTCQMHHEGLLQAAFERCEPSGNWRHL